MEIRNEIQKEAVNALLSTNYGTGNISVRLGKTLIGLTIASKFKKVLVSYPNVSILDSWKSDANKFSISLDNITFTTHISLPKHNVKDYEVLILDEIDQVAENSINWVINNLPERIYGLTGTPANFGVKKDFMNKYCPIVYTKSLEDITGILVKDYRIIVHLLEPSSIKDIKLAKGGYWSEKAKIAFWDRKYNQTHNFQDMLKLIQAIQNSPTKLNYFKQLSTKLDRALLFLETIKQCEELPFQGHYSGNKNSEQNLLDFQEGKINKLTCVRQISAGITFQNLQECVLLHCYSSNNKAHQRIARSLNYSEGEQATAHIIGLAGTKDEKWIQSGLQNFESNKIEWKNIQ